MKQRIESIVSKLQEASAAYYGDGNSLLSDAEYDALRDRLAELDPNNSFLAEVGAAVSGSPLTKVTHIIPMGSLNKCGGEKRSDEYKSWVRNSLKNPKTPVVIQWKLDGVSIELIYDNGNFVQAITRGDGIIGEDVTHTIKSCAPAKINAQGKVSIRAEAVIPITTWKKHFENQVIDGRKMSNPRNTVAGIVRRKTDLEQSSLVHLKAYDILRIDGDDFDSEVQKTSKLTGLGFDTVLTIEAKADEVEKIAEKFESDRDTVVDCMVDGIVIKANEISLQKKLGEHDGRPKWAIAWKFAPQGGHSTLKDVEWNVGTSGRITPVALIDPINVAGVTISRVTLHNADEIERLGIQIGDTIEVIRAGDVIPRIVRVVSQGKNRIPILLQNCPSCGGTVSRDGPMWVCNNKGCEGVSLRRVETWVKKREIMNLGTKYISTLFGAGITTIPELYNLGTAGLLNAGITAGMATKINTEIEKSRKVSLSDFIGSLSIDMLGRSEARNIIALGFNSLQSFLSLTPDDLMKFEGYKDTKANRIVDGIQASRKLIEELTGLLEIIEDKPKAVIAGKLNGNSFCFTGAASRPRKELHALVEANGGVVKDSISKDLNYLVVADPTSTSAKTAKAQKLGVKLISEDDFVGMCN